MSVVNYSSVWTGDKPKQANCIDCQMVFKGDDKVRYCKYDHIFHEKCWPGACSTTICKKEASERFWQPINETIAHVLGFGMAVGFIGLCVFISNGGR